MNTVQLNPPFKGTAIPVATLPVPSWIHLKVFPHGVLVQILPDLSINEPSSLGAIFPMMVIRMQLVIFTVFLKLVTSR